MSRVPLSPTVATTTTSTSSNALLFPFDEPPGSPAPSSQTTRSRAQRTAEARDAFTASLRSAGAHLDHELQARARDLHANAAVIAKQNNELLKQKQIMAAENEELEAIVREQREALMDLGIRTRSEAQLNSHVGLHDEDTRVGDVLATEGNEGDSDLADVLDLGDVNDLDSFLKGVEKDLLVLEETCRIVEEGEGPEYDDDWTEGHHDHAEEIDPAGIERLQGSPTVPLLQ